MLFSCVRTAQYKHTHRHTQRERETVFCRYKFFFANIGTCNKAWYSALLRCALQLVCLFCISICIYSVYVLVCIEKPAVISFNLRSHISFSQSVSFSCSLSLSHERNHFCIENSMRNTQTIRNIFCDWS